MLLSRAKALKKDKNAFAIERVPTLKLKKSRYRVSIRGPLLWNNILTAAEKTQESLPKFRTTIKEKLLSMTNEITFFE